MWHVADGWARYLTAGIIGLVAEDAHVAALGLDSANHAPEHGGLAAAARPQEAVDGSFGNGYVDVVEDCFFVSSAAHIVAHVAALDGRAQACR